MADVWDKLLECSQIVKHEFDLKYGDIIGRLKRERGNVCDLTLVSGDERDQIAASILAELLGYAPQKPEYEEILEGQEIYNKLEGK